MVINKVLEYILNPPSVIPVLRVLNERVVGISGREAARLSGLSIRAAQVALSKLTEIKIVNRHIGGRDYLFSLNRDNFLTQNIISSLYDFENDFKQNIFSSIKKRLLNDSVSVIVFGSVARRNESSKSDLDICVVYENNSKPVKEKTTLLYNELYKKYSVSLAPYYISISDFKKKAKYNKPPVNNILKEGFVLSGKSFKELLW